MEKQRTLTQNRALHLMFEHLALELSEAGLDMKKTLKPEVDIPWEKESVKTWLWKPLQMALLGKESTTELTTIEFNDFMSTIRTWASIEHGIWLGEPGEDREAYL